MAGKRGRGRGRGKGKAAAAAAVVEEPVEEPVEEMQQSEEAEPEKTEEMETSETQQEEETAENDVQEEAAENTEENEEEQAHYGDGTEKAPIKKEDIPENPGDILRVRNQEKNPESLFLQVRGFPYDTPIENMAKYFEISEEDYSGCEVALGMRGKPCGEFFFKCASEQIALKVLYKHKEIYEDTGRYVDVFRCSEEYYNRRCSINFHFSEEFDGTIKFKFIPFNASPEGVVKSLLEGITYLEDTLTCPTSASGKTTGIAYVQFANFSEARKILEKNGTDGIKIVESCNNELRGALLSQAKLTYMKKWADAAIGGGTAFNRNPVGAKRENPQQTPSSEISPESDQQEAPEFQAKKPKTENTAPEVTPQSFIADIKSNAPNNPNKPAPVKVTPPKPKPVNNSPYPHIITLSSVEAGTKATEIQKFFKPHRAIAVNIRAGGFVDVAFKTHDVAEKAMEKQGSPLKNFVPDFELNSVA